MRTRWKAVALVLLGTLVPALHATAGEPAIEQESLDDDNVVSVRGESLPAGIRLSIFTEHLLAFARNKLAPGGGGIASVNLFLEGTGLEGSAVATLAFVVRQDDEFSRDQLARWREERRRATRAGRERLFEGVSDAFVMERAEFVGGVLGRLLRERQPDSQLAGAVLRQILHLRGRTGSVFSDGGDGPSYEDFEREARQFEAGFEREFGVPLQALIRRGKEEKP